jgi:hypothetical protein
MLPCHFIDFLRHRPYRFIYFLAWHTLLGSILKQLGRIWNQRQALLARMLRYRCLGRLGPSLPPLPRCAALALRLGLLSPSLCFDHHPIRRPTLQPRRLRRPHQGHLRSPRDARREGCPGSGTRGKGDAHARGAGRAGRATPSVRGCSSRHLSGHISGMKPSISGSPESSEASLNDAREAGSTGRVTP